MGFERLCMAIKHYFKLWYGCVYTLSKSGEITGLKYTPNSVILNDSEESEEQNKTNIAIRVIVDHVRAVAFAIAWTIAFQYRSRICDSAYFTSCNTFSLLEYQRTFYLIGSCFSGPNGWGFP
jgi:hypothetical protein